MQGSVPFAFAGGPTATSNPEPFSAFLDFFALGDGEELLVEIAACLRACKRARRTRHESLLELARSVDGVYVPQFYTAPDGFGGTVFPCVDGVPERPRRRVATPDPFTQVRLLPPPAHARVRPPERGQPAGTWPACRRQNVAGLRQCTRPGTRPACRKQSQPKAH